MLTDQQSQFLFTDWYLALHCHPTAAGVAACADEAMIWFCRAGVLCY